MALAGIWTTLLLLTVAGAAPAQAPQLASCPTATETKACIMLERTQVLTRDTKLTVYGSPFKPGVGVYIRPLGTWNGVKNPSLATTTINDNGALSTSDMNPVATIGVYKLPSGLLHGHSDGG